MGLVILKFLKSVLTFGITFPLWVVLALWVWFKVDKTSEVRQAVEQAVVKLVAGAELEAAKAEAENLALINAALKAKADAEAEANRRFAENLTKAQFDLENANDQINELVARPVDPACVVDDFIFDRLRNKRR